jgi:hypothetical protein
MTDDELQMAAAEMFCEDIYNLVKYNELFDVAVARTRIVDAANDQSPEQIICDSVGGQDPGPGNNNSLSRPGGRPSPGTHNFIYQDV